MSFMRRSKALPGIRSVKHVTKRRHSINSPSYYYMFEFTFHFVLARTARRRGKERALAGRCRAGLDGGGVPR